MDEKEKTPRSDPPEAAKGNARTAKPKKKDARKVIPFSAKETEKAGKKEDEKREARVVGAAKSVASLLKIAKSATVPSRAKLLISIVNNRDEARVKEVIDERSVALSYTFAGTGTARSALLDYLGIGETEKAVVLSVIPENDEEMILREIRKKISLYLAGRGISFTVPLAGISQIVANGITKAATIKITDGGKRMKSEERKFDLVVAAVASNYVDTAMEAARTAGAAGGTIIRARTLDNAKAEQFIGISLVAEQEILLILTKKENTLAIMNALSESVGVKTEAGGVIFSVPVDRTAGISIAEEGEPTPAPEEKK